MGQHDAAEQRIEVWAGAESTVNRVGDRYFDQTVRSGHHERIADLDLFARLGIRAIRYPVLWERTAPDGPERADWSWPDERLTRLRELGVRPIVGLVHHGSGPRDTDLLDPAFPARLAAYAGAVARRYPWVEEYTPVNEPLTTARFSALYGHWYPHRRDDLSFARALLTQCRAVVLSMRAIREINPAARLIQTDDLGKTYGTSTLAYQAAFENERRWLTFDLLTGRLTPDRVPWKWLRNVGVEEGELAWFLDNPCPPDVVGVNTYLSSERFLDERVERYPTETPGTNGRHRYVDVLASRVLPEGAAGPAALLGEAWDRYRLPLAVTEAHNGCTREEQLRWLDGVWRGAEEARTAGADVRAVTVWSLLGAYDWHTLVTRDEGVYEPGVFDLRSPAPRPTALAGMVRDLAAGRRPAHPVLAAPGWWRRPDRFLYGHAVVEGRLVPVERAEAPVPADARPILLVGGTTTLGRAVAQACRARGLPTQVLDLGTADPVDPSALGATLAAGRPWAVVDATGYELAVVTSSATRRSASRFAEHTRLIAAACAQADLPLLVFSSARVFAGEGEVPRVESDLVAPLDAEGRILAALEEGVLADHPAALVVRMGPPFGTGDDRDLVTVALRALATGRSSAVSPETTVSPTYLPDLADAALDLLIDGERRIWHLANRGITTWAEIARDAAALRSLEPAGPGLRSPRQAVVSTPPAYGLLGSERGWLLPPLKDALARYAGEMKVPAAAA